jgi:hypothetical protein
LSTVIFLAPIYKDYSKNSFIIKSLPLPFRQKQAFGLNQKSHAFKNLKAVYLVILLSNKLKSIVKASGFCDPRA